MSNAFTADRERDVKTSIRKVEYPCRECDKTVLGRIGVMVKPFVYIHLHCYQKMMKQKSEESE